MSNYRTCIRQQLNDVKSERIAKAKREYYGTDWKSVEQMKKDQREYARLERKFWSA